MDPQRALANARDVAALWSVNWCDGAAVVYAACELLVAGIDGPAVCALAAVSVQDADDEVPVLLEAALDEVGLAYRVKGTAAADEAGLRTMAAWVLRGAIPPRALASLAQRRFGLTDSAPPIEALCWLHEEYAIQEDAGAAVAQVDAEVRAQARLLGDPSP